MALRKMEELPVMEEDEALEYIQSHHAFLVFDERVEVEIWSPGHKMPQSLRRALVKHRASIKARMHAADKKTCPDWELHKRYTRGTRTCGVCKKIPC